MVHLGLFSCFSQASARMGEVIRKIPTRIGMSDPRVVPFAHSIFKELEFSSAVITRTLEWTLASHTPFYGRMIHMRTLPASTCSVVYLEPTLDCAVRSFCSQVVVRKCLKFVYLLNFLKLQGTLHAVCLVQLLSLSACTENLCTYHIW